MRGKRIWPQLDQQFMEIHYFRITCLLFRSYTITQPGLSNKIFPQPCILRFPSQVLLLNLSPLYDVLYHTSHIFSENLSSTDDNDQHKDIQKDKDVEKYTHKVLERLNLCHILGKQGVQGFKIGIFTLHVSIFLLLGFGWDGH